MSSWSASGSRRWSEAAQGCFVGRRNERAQLQDAWRAAREGSRQVRFVGGEPGAGKSRLLAQLAVDLRDDTASVLGGACPSTLASPYEPFVAPVGALRGAIASRALALASTAQDDSAVARTVALLDTIAGERPAGSASRRDLLDAVVTAMRSAADVEPLALLLDDVHWAGETAWELLSYLVEQTRDLPLLIVATQRTTASDRTEHLVRHMARLYRLEGVRRVDLPPLATDEVAAYLVQEAGLPATQARALAADLHDRTGGNAYFVHELVQNLAAERRRGSLRTDRRTPQSVHDAVQARLGALEPTARATVELAAVVGDVVDVDLLVTAGGTKPDDVLEHLDAAVDAHLLEPVDENAVAVRFRHAIAREVVLGGIPSARRAGLHRDVARTLEVRGGRTAAHVVQVAHHYERAHVLGHRAEAVRYLRLAATLAQEGLAHDEAADLFERAAAIDDDPVRADDATLLAARERMLTGGFPRSRALAEPIAENSLSPHRLRAAVQYEDANWRTNLVGGRSAALLQAALDSGRDDDEALRVRAKAGLGRALAFDGDHDLGRSLLQQSLARARELGDADLQGDVLVASLVHGSSVVDAEAKLAYANELTELCLRNHDLWRLGPAASYRTMLGYQGGDPALARAGLADLRRVAEGTHQPYFAYLAGCVDYSAHLAAGHLTRAAQVSDTLLETGAAVELDENVGPDGQYGVQQFVLRRELGQLEAVRELLRDEEDLGEHWVPGLLALYTELGMHDAARRALWWLLGPGASDLSPGARPGILTFMSDAAVFLRDVEAARRVRAELAPYAGLNIMFGSLVASMGSADRYLGSLDAILDTGDWDAHFRRAEAMDRTMSAHLHVAHTLAAHAIAHRTTGAGCCDVGALMAEARHIATRAGSQRVLRMVDAVDGARSSRRADGLTEREVEVLRLVAQGLSNRQVARSLVISENTAANHMRSILLKTGCENRTRAARYAAAQGLLA